LWDALRSSVCAPRRGRRGASETAFPRDSGDEECGLSPRTIRWKWRNIYVAVGALRSSYALGQSGRRLGLRGRLAAAREVGSPTESWVWRTAVDRERSWGTRLIGAQSGIWHGLHDAYGQYPSVASGGKIAPKQNEPKIASQDNAEELFAASRRDAERNESPRIRCRATRRR
jgi:hypothetical protein